MNPVYGILLAALLFAVFGALSRRKDAQRACGTDPRDCDRADDVAGCSACHPMVHESTESSHGRP